MGLHLLLGFGTRNAKDERTTTFSTTKLSNKERRASFKCQFVTRSAYPFTIRGDLVRGGLLLNGKVYPSFKMETILGFEPRFFQVCQSLCNLPPTFISFATLCTL